MLKVLIIDDEVQIRKGLRMKINWEQEGCIVAAEASNGRDGLEKLKQHDIDIVISDVRMPIMDGIEFARRCQPEHPDLKVIILSGYSDFEYAKSSLQAGVKDYLLKPVAPDELIDALKKMRIEIEKEKSEKIKSESMTRLVHNQLEEMREKYLLYLVKEEHWQSDNMIERLQQLQLEEFADPDVTAQFITVENRMLDENRDQEKGDWLQFVMLCREHAKSAKGIYSFYDGSYRNMIHFIKRVDIEPITQGSVFVKELQLKVKKQLGLETVIGIGRVVTGHKEFKNGYISALLSWSQSQMGSRSQVIEVADKNEVFNFSGDFERKLINSIENADYQSFENDIDEILRANNQSMMSFSFVANRILFLLGSLAEKYDITTKEIKQTIWDCQQTIWELTSQCRVIRQLTNLGEVIIQEINQVRFSSSGAELVENVRKYLDKHYADEVSLSTLSDLFHINSAYLSEIFKVHVGKNFSDYLNHLRMKNACQFLKEPQLKIIDVAYLVGFSNSGYFSTVFKKYYGSTPAEFRKKSLN